MNNWYIVTLILVLLVATCTGLHAQQSAPGERLHSEIADLDRRVFAAFNTRDTATFNRFFDPQLEFYHDKGGLTGYAHTVGFAKSLAESKNDLRRELVAGSLEVYPVKDYGAIQIGSHRFCHTEGTKNECGIFKFVHIWKKTGTEWRITRIISYDH